MTRPTARDDGLSHREFQNSLVAAIHEASPDGILVVDDQDVIVSHNQLLFDVLGITPEDLPGDHGGVLAGHADRPLLALVADRVKDPEEFVRQVKELYANPQLDDHREIELKDGRILERHSRVLWGPSRRYLGRVWFFRDITERKRAEESLRQMSQRDPLTGVANRRYFLERGNEELARARRFGRDLSFIMLDLDHFKRVNDRWGHGAGDKVLSELCHACDTLLRRIDVMGRVGGEEFAVLMPDTDLDGAYLLAERLRLAAEALQVEENGDAIRFTLSAGVATLLPADASIDEALKRADHALYEAKGAGRNRTERA